MTDEPPASGTAPTPTPAHTPSSAPSAPVVSTETVPLPPFVRSFWGNPFGTRGGKAEFNLVEALKRPERAKPKG